MENTICESLEKIENRLEGYGWVAKGNVSDLFRILQY